MLSRLLLHSFFLRNFLFSFFALCLCCEVSFAQYQRKTPSGEYLDPAASFFLHGYVTSVFSSPEKEYGKSPETNGQILTNGVSSVTDDNEGGFQHDFALFVGSEEVQGFQGIFEIHYVRSATDPVVTEAKVIWSLLRDENKSWSLGFGRQWWPFGIQNRQWFSPINEFNVLSPIATHVLPPHHNEIGLWLEGNGEIAGVGFNFVTSLANGPMSFSLQDNVRENTSGTQKGLTVTSRLGVFPFGENTEIGFSFTSGRMRDAASPNSSGASTDPLEFAADHQAVAVDLQVDIIDRVRLKGQWVNSQEDLEGASVINRSGFDLDLGYQLPLNQKIGYLWSLTPKIRFADARIERIGSESLKLQHIGFGFNYRPSEFATVKVEYVTIKEVDATEVDNDIFNVGISYSW